jgi:hypothetical protein
LSVLYTLMIGSEVMQQSKGDSIGHVADLQYRFIPRL